MVSRLVLTLVKLLGLAQFFIWNQRMVEPQEIFIPTPWGDIAAKAWGPETGHRVLAVHGWLDNAASFDLLAPLLPATRFVAIDMPGHGLSMHRAPGVPYHFVDFVADVVAAADGLNWTQFSFISHSLGAAVSSFVAALQPERIEHLVLIEGIGPVAGDPVEAPKALASSIAQMNQLPDKQPPVYPNLEAMIKARVRVGDLTYDAAARIIERSTIACEGGFTWTSDPRLRFTSPLYLTEDQITSHLRAIQAPSLLINGAQGIIAKRQGIEQRYAAVHDLQVISLSGGHHLHMETPGPIAEQIEAFLTPSSQS